MGNLKYVAEGKKEFERLEKNVKKLFQHCDLSAEGTVFAEYGGEHVVYFRPDKFSTIIGVSALDDDNPNIRLGFASADRTTLEVDDIQYWVYYKPKSSKEE